MLMMIVRRPVRSLMMGTSEFQAIIISAVKIHLEDSSCFGTNLSDRGFPLLSAEQPRYIRSSSTMKLDMMKILHHFFNFY